MPWPALGAEFAAGIAVVAAFGRVSVAVRASGPALAAGVAPAGDGTAAAAGAGSPWPMPPGLQPA